MKATKSASPQRTRRGSAKPLRKGGGGTPGPTGKLTKEERDPLLLQAIDAFDHQTKLGRVEPGFSFDEWRRNMVFDRVACGGISKINRSHWRDVMALFLELAGREDDAFKLLNKTGVKGYRPVDGNDTWESCETYVHQIRQALADHSQAVVTHEKGHIYEGWILTAARQRNSKDKLTMDTLAERLDPKTLCGLLSHLNNHIRLREGRADPDRRAARVYPKKPDPGEMDDPF